MKFLLLAVGILACVASTFAGKEDCMNAMKDMASVGCKKCGDKQKVCETCMDPSKETDVAACLKDGGLTENIHESCVKVISGLKKFDMNKILEKFYECNPGEDHCKSLQGINIQEMMEKAEAQAKDESNMSDETKKCMEGVKTKYEPEYKKHVDNCKDIKLNYARWSTKSLDSMKGMMKEMGCSDDLIKNLIACATNSIKPK